MSHRLAGGIAAIVAAAVLPLVTSGPAAAAGCPTVDPVSGAPTPAWTPGDDWSGCDLSHVDLSGKTLEGGRFIGSTMVGANLSGADLVGGGAGQAAVFTGADLTGANLVGATTALSLTFTRPNFQNANLSQVTATGANLGGSDFLDANLTSADFSSGSLSNPDFPRTVLTGATLTGAVLGTTNVKFVRSGGIVGTPASLPSAYVIRSGFLVGPGSDLTGADLHGLDLTGIDLTDVDLSDADLTGANLTGARMYRTANFIRANFTAAVLVDSNWSGTMPGDQVNFATADLTHSTLTNMNLTGGKLSGANLSRADLSGSNLTQAALIGANLTAADVARTNVDGADLSSATLTRVRSGLMAGSPVALPTSWTVSTGYLVGPGADLNYAGLYGIDLSGRNLAGTALNYANLSHATLVGTVLTGAELNYTNLISANLHNGSLSNAHFDYADLDSAQLSGTDMTGALMYGANLTGATFSGTAVAPGLTKPTANAPSPAAANLTRANFTNADLTSTRFDRSNLTGATFYRANVVGTTFVGVTWGNTTCVDGSVSNVHNGGSCLSAIDTTAPTASLLAPTGAFVTTTSVTVGWTGSDTGGSGIASFDVRVNHAPVGGGAASAWTTWKSATATRAAVLTGLAPGYGYCFSVRARDLAGHVSGWSASRCTSAPVDDRALSASRGWRRGAQSGWFAGTFSSTNGTGSTLSRSVAGTRQVGVIATICPSCGSVAVYVGSTKVGSISLRSNATVARRTILLPAFTSRRVGAIRLVVTSRAKLVKIDALLTAFN